jgi:hypothetical protein
MEAPIISHLPEEDAEPGPPGRTGHPAGAAMSACRHDRWGFLVKTSVALRVIFRLDFHRKTMGLCGDLVA